MAINDYAVMPLTDYQAACNAVRAKDGSSGTIVSGQLATKITNIPTGRDTSDGNITAGDVLSGKIGYNASGRVVGNIASKSATTYNVSSTNQTIAAKTYCSGAQTIRAVMTSNIEAGNIRAGVVVKVGDSADRGRIISVTGTYDPSSVQSYSGSGSGNNSTNISFSKSGLRSGTIIAWGITGTSALGGVYKAGGSSGSGWALRAGATEPSGLIVTSGDCSCTISSNSISFSLSGFSSTCQFLSSASYSWWVKFQ